MLTITEINKLRSVVEWIASEVPHLPGCAQHTVSFAECTCGKADQIGEIENVIETASDDAHCAPDSRSS